MRSKIITFTLVICVVGLSFTEKTTASHCHIRALTDQIAAQEQKPERSSKPLSENALNAELKSAKGPVFRLSDYKGSVLVLSFWATWCLPCKFQTPLLVKLQTEFRSEGVKVVELTTEDPVVSARNVRLWMRTYKVNYRVGWAPEELFKALTLENTALPQVFIVDRNGNILKRFIGFSRDKTPSVMKQAIEDVLESQ